MKCFYEYQCVVLDHFYKNLTAHLVTLYSTNAATRPFPVFGFTSRTIFDSSKLFGMDTIRRGFLVKWIWLVKMLYLKKLVANFVVESRSRHGLSLSFDSGAFVMHRSESALFLNWPNSSTVHHCKLLEESSKQGLTTTVDPCFFDLGWRQTCVSSTLYKEWIWKYFEEAFIIGNNRAGGIKLNNIIGREEVFIIGNNIVFIIINNK